MHIDLGAINENFYTFTDENGEGFLDMEDGLVARDGIKDDGEDVGLDRIKDGEPGDQYKYLHRGFWLPKREK